MPIGSAGIDRRPLPRTPFSDWNTEVKCKHGLKDELLTPGIGGYGERLEVL